MSDVFEYNKNKSYEENFYEWYAMNSKERKQANEKAYDEIIGRRVFSEQYGNKPLLEKLGDIF
tara:strand:+ start:97 stop:285 length:189 start_codon:yes stop_codon:yes gene_type:complete